MSEFELAYQLIQAIKQTDEWECIWMEYPGVVGAKAHLDAVMEQVSARIPGEMVDELFDAMGKLDWANECASVLYGIRLACSVSRAAADPAGFSQYVARQKKNGGRGLMYRGECNITHGGSKTRLYRIWKQMRIRCNCVTNPTYKYYGARGITICDDWNDFAVFREWALAHGYTDELSIDRIDNDGPYCPENCRWVSMAEQTRNTRNCKRYEHDGVTLTHNEWARRLGIDPASLTKRIKCHGLEYALSAPKSKK